MPQGNYPGNLTDIFNSGSPEAMQMAFQQQSNANALDQAEQQRQGLENYFTQQNMPTRLQQADTTLQMDKARLPGIVAESSQKALDFNKSSALFDSDVAAKLAENKTKLSTEQAKKLSNMGQIMAQFADMVTAHGMPPLEIQQQVPQEWIQAARTPQGLKWLKDTGAAVMQHTAEGINNQLNRVSQEKIHAGNNAAAIEVAKINASRPRGGSGSSLSFEELIKRAKTPQQRMTLFGSAAAEAEFNAENEQDPDNKAQYIKMSQYYRNQEAQAQGQYETELKAKWRPGIDIQETQRTGKPVNTQPPTFRQSSGFRRESDGSITLE